MCGWKWIEGIGMEVSPELLLYIVLTLDYANTVCIWKIKINQQGMGKYLWCLILTLMESWMIIVVGTLD